MPDFSVEDQYKNKIVVGIDEAGRGAWAGPVVVGAAIINTSKDTSYINDSKKISKEKRYSFSKQILLDHDAAVGESSVEEIFSLGINRAIFLAMERAVNKLTTPPEIAIIDGNYKCNIGDLDCRSIIKGDQLSVSIAAASIIAKVYRDNLMSNMPEVSDKYLWAKNSGYGTSNHIEMLNKHGVSNLHRKNYKPILKLLETI
ncbi:MAG: ribonuclease HII [Rickettsiales bacterium]